MAVAALDPLLSDAGWAYASLPPQEPGDPGRFHALFGRDSLITALQVLPEGPEVAVATLPAHGVLQARVDEPATDEEPGKILHEYRPVAEPRFAAAGWPVRDGELRYYGSADSTSWFLVVLAALQDDGLAAELADARRRAGEWLARALDAGGGFVRYGPRRAPGGLAHQGWRDATAPVSEHSEGSGIVRPDGSDPEPPLADADCQAAAHAALRALARLDPDGDWDARAAALRARVGEAFAPGADWALAVEAEGTPVPGAGSQLGWLLWAGALDGAARDAALDRLCEPDVLCAHGLRTLSSDSPMFAPGHYHRGSVWPFDSWIGWGGLRAAGRHDEAERVRTGVLSALEQLGRAPELYAVEVDGTVRGVPLANRVQAWTVGAIWALRNGWDGRS